MYIHIYIIYILLFILQLAAPAESCRSHQGRPEDQAIVATVECNQADVGCLKDGPVT